MKEVTNNKSLLQTLCPSRTRMVQSPASESYRVHDQLQQTKDGRLPTIVRASDGGTDGGTVKDKEGDTLCWVARAVYGETNPQWLLFRNWLLSQAPLWFKNLYIRHGESFAAWVSDKPTLKLWIRRWMDSRIAHATV